MPSIEVGRDDHPALSTAHDQHQQELSEWEAAVAKAKQKTQKEPKKPRMMHFWSSDTTPEAIGMMLETSLGITLVRDELAGWVKGFDNYRAGGERQAHLEAWSGRTLKIDRASKETVLIDNPVICVAGGIQPELIVDLTDALDGRRH